MPTKTARRLYTCLAFALLVPAAPALAQYTPRSVSNPPSGEIYHIEGAIGFWFPTADIRISSESIGIPGTDIDVKKDLGVVDQHFPEFHVTLRPARKHKFRFQLIPLSYEAQHTLTRTIVFNGQEYTIGIPVKSDLEWKAYRFGYEYDFVARDWGFVGVIFEAKYTDVGATLTSPYASEFARAQGPIPAIGGIVRVYVVPSVSVTGELSGIDIPTIQDQYQAHYTELNIYGTWNANRYIGAQFGYRLLNVGYMFKEDTGHFIVDGVHFGVVARF